MLSRSGLWMVFAAVVALNPLGFSGVVSSAWGRQGGGSGAGGGGGEPPSYGIDFVTIGAAGNAGYTGLPADHLLYNRGAVPYEYRIGRFETTTAEWLEYYNTFSTQAGVNFRTELPLSWGAIPDIDYQGPGERYRLSPGLENAAMIPLYGLTWRSAAHYCNWLHNGRASGVESRLNGAYDASTFTRNANGSFNDQRRHHPDARFWIPTLDEWLKAAYYDPNRFGEGMSGWWQYNTSSDVQPISGLPPPGPGETSAGVRLPDFAEFNIPLGAYSHVTSPWGLFDTSGGFSEWAEETFEEQFQRRFYRVSMGSYVGAGDPATDEIGRWFGQFPLSNGSTTIRIASAIPAPPAVCWWLSCGVAFTLRRRRTPWIESTLATHFCSAR